MFRPKSLIQTDISPRTLQYGQIAIGLGEPDQDRVKKTTMGKLEVKGDHGLLNLPPEDTVFYVGGFPDTFKVRAAGPVLSPACYSHPAIGVTLKPLLFLFLLLLLLSLPLSSRKRALRAASSWRP